MQISHIKTKVFIPNVLVSMILFSAESLHAMEFTSSFFMPVSINYDSNIQMANSDNEESVGFYNAIPRLTVVGNDGVNAVSFNGSVLFQRSSNESISEDRKDPNLGLGWVRSFERGDFSLSTNYNKSSTRVSERNVTGLVFNDGSATTRSYDAGLNYLVTEKFRLSTGVSYQETRFSAASLDDFNTKTFNSQLNYLYNEQMTPFIQFSISRLENETNQFNNFFANNLNASGDTISRNLLVGLDYIVSPQLNFDMALGVNNVSSAGSSWIGNGRLTYSINEKSSLVGSISRNVTPTGIGGFLKIDNLALNYTYDLDEKNHLGADVNWSITRDFNDSNFKFYSAFYSYDINEDWAARTYVQYRTLQATGVDANAYLIGFSLSYNHPNLF